MVMEMKEKELPMLLQKLIQEYIWQLINLKLLFIIIKLVFLIIN